MKRHPENKIRKLAQSPADTRPERTAEEHDTLQIPLAARRTPDQAPIAERLPGTQYDAVQAGRSKFQVDDFIVLILHIDVLQLAQQRRAMPEMDMGTGRSKRASRETQASEMPQRVAQQGIIHPSAPQPQTRTPHGARRRKFRVSELWT